MNQDFRTTRGDFKFQYKVVQDLTNELIAALKQNAASISAHTFTLPTITEDVARERRLAQASIRLKFNDEDAQASLDQPFNVLHETGEVALKKTLQHIGKFRAMNNESTRYSIKLPGIVEVQCNLKAMQTITDLLDKLNAEKKQLKHVIHGLSKSVDERFEIVHDIEPGLIFSMATRSLPVFFQKNIVSARFSWEHKPQIKTLTKKQVIEKIDRSAAYTPNNGASQAGFLLHLQEERKLISHFSDGTLFNIIRDAPAAPILKLRFNEPKNPNNNGTETTLRKDIHSHSPVFLLNCTEDFKFKSLGNYRGRTVNTARGEAIIPRLHLYLKSKPQNKPSFI